MQKFMLGITFIATLCSFGCFSLIVFEILVKLSGNRSFDYLLLQSIVVAGAISLILATSTISYFLKSKLKMFLIGVNLALLLAWVLLLSFNIIVMAGWTDFL